jgi:hypothetical protein
MTDKKYCRDCHQEITWPPFVEGQKSYPLNLDGTPHRCKSEKAAAAKPKPNEPTTGEYCGITRGQIGIKRKDGTILMISVLPTYLEQLAPLSKGNIIQITEEDGFVVKVEDLGTPPKNAVAGVDRSSQFVKGSEIECTSDPQSGGSGDASAPQDRIRSSIHETGEYVPMRERLITLQAVYKSQVQNVPELLPILSLEDVEDQETYKRFVNAYNRVMNLVMERTLSDARELIREAGKRE